MLYLPFGGVVAAFLLYGLLGRGEIGEIGGIGGIGRDGREKENNQKEKDMKGKLLKGIGGMALFAVLAVFMSSCVNDSYWWDDSDYYDHRLDGYWELVQYNSDPVYDDDVNFLYFNGNGRGTYYYFDRGYRESEPMYYDSQPSNTGTSNYQLNIQYGNGRPTTVNYWFTHGNNTLWMQWRTSGGRVVTYVYDRIDYRPW